MRRVFTALLLFVSMAFASRADAMVLPDMGRYYFTGTTEELFRIRAGMAHIAGFEAEAWTFPASYTHEHTLILPPWGMGVVDCMDAFYEPGQGPYDGAEDYLGMSTTIMVDDVAVGVEIPALEDLVTAADWPGQCYGYQFAVICGSYFGQWICADPEP